MHNRFAVALLALVLAHAAEAHQVIGIIDGDTLVLNVAGRATKIRLANIDAPEKRQPFGQRSKQNLSDACWGKDAEYQPVTIDRYGRTIATVKCAGVDVIHRQVMDGMAWVYTKYNRDHSLLTLQLDARRMRKGLWADGTPIAPWEWRRIRNTK